MKKILVLGIVASTLAGASLWVAKHDAGVKGAADGSLVAIDSEPILKTASIAIDSEPILRIDRVAIDSEPILMEDPKAIDSEPILEEEFEKMAMIYKKDGKYSKVTYKTTKVEELSDKEGQKREKRDQVQRLSTK